jgi:hypothetical protein
MKVVRFMTREAAGVLDLRNKRKDYRSKSER